MGKFDDFVKRGESLFCQGKYLQAMEFFLVGAESSDVDSCYHLAKTYIELGNEFEAKKALHKILAVDPDHQQAVELLVPLMAGCVSGCQKSEVNASGQMESIGVFSVGPYSKVTFAPGNLQFQATSGTYRFAPEQYEIIGQGNENISQHYDGWIDLFGWGTGNCPYKDSSNGCAYNTFHDWSERVSGDWRLLDNREWEYLIKNHSGGSATVCGQEGWVLLPDDWKGFFNDQRTGFSDNVYNKEQWERLERLGVVFLPNAGCRCGKQYSKEREYYSFSTFAGSYWVEGKERYRGSGYYYGVSIKIECTRPELSVGSYYSENEKHLGLSVRLVKNID